MSGEVRACLFSGESVELEGRPSLVSILRDVTDHKRAEEDRDASIDPQLPVFFGDRVRLLEVFQNLIDNAIKFMGDQPEPRVEVGQRQDGEEVVLYVRDNGVGIDPRYHQKIFGLFDRLDQKVAGTGIGLTLAQRTVEVHQGRIWVESEGLGQGSMFCLTLPPAETT